MIADPLVQQVRDRVPDLAPQLSYILAHAARSMNSLQAKPKTPVATVKVQAKVPASPFGAAGARSGVQPARKAVEQAKEQFEKTGTVEDFIAARTAKLTHR